MSVARLPGLMARRRVRSQTGASAVEYGLLIAGIATLIIAAIFAFGGGANGLFHGSCKTVFEDNPGQTSGQCN